jgi:hypothetical protein
MLQNDYQKGGDMNSLDSLEKIAANPHYSLFCKRRAPGFSRKLKTVNPITIRYDG